MCPSLASMTASLAHLSAFRGVPSVPTRTLAPHHLRLADGFWKKLPKKQVQSRTNTEHKQVPDSHRQQTATTKCTSDKEKQPSEVSEARNWSRARWCPSVASHIRLTVLAQALACPHLLPQAQITPWATHHSTSITTRNTMSCGTKRLPAPISPVRPRRRRSCGKSTCALSCVPHALCR